MKDIFLNPLLSQLLRYPWNRNPPNDGTINDVYDAKIWNEKFLPIYGDRDYNIALGMTFGKSSFTFVVCVVQVIFLIYFFFHLYQFWFCYIFEYY